MKKAFTLLLICILGFSVLFGCNNTAEYEYGTIYDSSLDEYIVTYSPDLDNYIVNCDDMPYFGYFDYDDLNCRSNYRMTDNESFYFDTVSSYKKYDDFTYQDFKDGVSIVKYSGENKVLKLPEEIDGKPVLKLGGYLTAGDNSSSSSDVPDSYYGALYKSKVEKVIIPSTVKEIEYSFFSTIGKYNSTGKGSISWIKVSDDNPYYTSVDGVLYSKDKSLLLKIPENYKNKNLAIADGTKTAYELISQSTVIVSIPASLEKITPLCSNGYNWFCNAETANNVTLKSIKVDSNNEYFSSDDGVLFNKDKTKLLIYPFAKKAKSYTVPNSVEKVRRMWLNDIIYLEKLTFGRKICKINFECIYDNNDGLDPLTGPNIKIIRGYKGTAAEDFVEKIVSEYELNDELIFEPID